MINKNNLTVRVKNWFDFSNLNEYILHWQVVGDNGKLLAEGNKEVNCAPHATADVTLGKVALPANVREGYLNLSWTRKEASPMVGTDWEVAYDQFVLPEPKVVQPICLLRPGRQLSRWIKKPVLSTH